MNNRFIGVAELSEKPLTHVVSIGVACRVAYNIRRFFDINTAYPFDWWITPTKSLIALLESFDVERLYDPDSLVLDWQGTTVRNQEFGVYLHHEFPRAWDVPGQPVVPNFRQLTDDPRRRTEYLVRRLESLDKPNERILFVREAPHDERGITEAAASVAAALVARFRSAQFALLFVNGERGDAPAWVAHVTIPEGPADDWRGDISAWQAAFVGLGAELRRGMHRQSTDRDLDADGAAKFF